MRKSPEGLRLAHERRRKSRASIAASSNSAGIGHWKSLLRKRRRYSLTVLCESGARGDVALAATLFVGESQYIENSSHGYPLSWHHTAPRR